MSISALPLIVVIEQMPGDAQWREHLHAHGLRAEWVNRNEIGRLPRILELLECDYDAPAAGPLRAIAMAGADHAMAYCCCADLVALEADLDNVRLGAIVDDLQPDHRAQIEAAVNETLDSLPACYWVDEGGNGCLTADSPLEFSAHAPERLIGLHLRDAMPVGADGARIRALLTELQMVLHTHPVNVERERLGLAPANGVWFWGGGVLPAHSALDLPPLSTDDAALAGFWIHAGCAERSCGSVEWSSAAVGRFGVISIAAVESNVGIFGAIRKNIGTRPVYVVLPGGGLLRLRRAGLLRRLKRRVLSLRSEVPDND